MFPPEPEKPWWYHLIWALPCMAATGVLGYWLKEVFPGVAPGASPAAAQAVADGCACCDPFGIGQR